jgi:hypothetical protein
MTDVRNWNPFLPTKDLVRATALPATNIFGKQQYISYVPTQRSERTEWSEVKWSPNVAYFVNWFSKQNFTRPDQPDPGTGEPPPSHQGPREANRQGKDEQRSNF